MNRTTATSFWRAFVGIMLAAACCLAAPVIASAATADGTASRGASASRHDRRHRPAADDADVPTNDDGTPRVVAASRSGDRSALDAGTTAAQALSLTKATAVVTDVSGYHAAVTVTNRSGRDWPAGRLVLSTNPRYTFRSRTDLRQWTQNDAAISTRTTLCEAQVPALPSGMKTTVPLDVTPDAQGLADIRVWGPKPLRIDYVATADDGSEAASSTLTTFLTRSGDGLVDADTPPLRMTVTLPLTTDGWTVDKEAAQTLLKEGKAGDVIRLDEEDAQLDRAVFQLVSDHPSLQVLADPTMMRELPASPTPAAITQPAGFDITAYAARGDADAYSRAGVAGASWTSDAAMRDLQQADPHAAEDTPVIAVEGKAQWTMDALTEAKRQGYDTVMATSDFEAEETATVHNARTTVPTDAGEVTVLVEQRELGRLAKGKATDSRSRAETTPAGRIVRFLAQSAFYQMEEPYHTRNLLVALADDAADGAEADMLMDAVESAPWLQLTGLKELKSSDPYLQGEQAIATVPADPAMGAKAETSFDVALRTLETSRDDITRFGSSVLVGATVHDARALERRGFTDADAHSDGGGGGGGKGSGDSPATVWLDRLLAVHDRLALHALSDDAAQRERLTGQADRFSGSIFDEVSITPSEKVTVVSETAQMPVTVSNRHPFPVRVRVSSFTDSTEIVTSHTATVDVPANGETQTQFTIRVSTTSAAHATLTLRDRSGMAFGAQQTTPITSVLRISDKTGFIIIALAAAMAVLGLWRQFHRKKDPDE